MILKFEAAVPQMVEISRELSFYFTFVSLTQTVFRSKKSAGKPSSLRGRRSPSFFKRFRSPKRLPPKRLLVLLKSRLFPVPHRLQHTKKASGPFPDALRFYFALPHPLFFGSRIRTVRSRRGGIRNAVRRAFVVRTGRRGLSLLRVSRIFGGGSGI